MEKVPSKISFKHWDEEVTITKGNSDLDINEFHQLCRRLALAVGYSDESVNEYFGKL
jgi:hypothetical protein